MSPRRAGPDTAPESPPSKSSDDPKIPSPTGFNGLPVWQPARPQTGQSAVLGFRPVETGGGGEMRPSVTGARAAAAVRPRVSGDAGSGSSKARSAWYNSAPPAPVSAVLFAHFDKKATPRIRFQPAQGTANGRGSPTQAPPRRLGAPGFGGPGDGFQPSAIKGFFDC